MPDIDLLRRLDILSDQRRNAVRNSKDPSFPVDVSYYVSADGCDENDGRSPETPWRTLKRVSDADLSPGNGVFFRRGDLFRGFVRTRPGVTYGAYGEGEKPKIYGWDSLADPSLWILADASRNIWKYRKPILDCGTVVFNDGEFHSRKLIPSYIGGRFVCRENEAKPFRMAEEMTQNLDMVCFYMERLTDRPSRGEAFPVPLIDDQSFGELYLRCDRGNPGSVFSSVEALPRRHLFQVKGDDNVTVDNLCLKYCGSHAVGASGPCVKGLHVTNCEIGWIGGSIQNYLGTDPNYPEGGRGTVTRYGNGVEIYGGCRDYTVENCYIYQVYDAGITHQFTVRDTPCRMEKIRYAGNLIEECVYSIEYFLETVPEDTESIMEDLEIRDNILRLSGCGWGQQRHNKTTPSHIKGWNFTNPARNFRISNNVFDRSAYRLLHLTAFDSKSLPHLCDNTYIQSRNGILGQYGSNALLEPEMLKFSSENVSSVLGDSEARICIFGGALC